jgi:hypothetical protein
MAISWPGETSHILSNRENSLFTYYLLEALPCKAHTLDDGFIRVFDVFAHVSEKVSKCRTEQHPFLGADLVETNFSIALYLGGKSVETNSDQGNVPGSERSQQSGQKKRMARSSQELETYRCVVVEIERHLDTLPARNITLDLLTTYENRLITVIETLRNASVQDMQSKEGVLQSIRAARDYLALAIFQHQERGINQQFVRYLRSCQTSLQSALKYWK